MTDLINPPAEPSAPPLESCARCAAPLAGDQRWCLNCGTRRSSVDGPFAVLAAPASAPPPVVEERTTAAIAPVGAPHPDGPPRWIAVAIALGLAAVLFATGLVTGLTGSDRGITVNVPPDQPPDVNVTVEGGGGGAIPVAADDGSLTELTSDWPDQDGWTVQLEVLPGDSDQAAVDAAKADAESGGAEDVGIVISDDYASLPPNKIIVYSGVFDTKAAASKALGGLKKDFKKAKVVQVSATGGDSGPVEEVSDEALENLESADPEEQQEASKNLPEEVGTGGEAPPVDDKAPGGGSEGTTIG